MKPLHRITVTFALASSLTLPALVLAQTPAFITSWGSVGSAPGQFREPYGIALDAAGHVFVSEYGGKRTQKFTSDGTYLTGWVNHPDPSSTSPWPSTSVAVGPTGNVYVATEGGGGVQIYDNNGVFLSLLGSELPTWGVAVDDAGIVYVASRLVIHKLTSDGTLIDTWPTAAITVNPFIALERQGHVVITDFDANKVFVYSTDGALINSWGSPGSGPGQFGNPAGVAIDREGRIYIAEYYNARIQVFSSNGTYLTHWGTPGNGPGQFTYPVGVVVDPDGNVYTTEDFIGRVQKFGPVFNHPPDVSEATVDASPIWPPNRRLVPVTISGVTDADGDPVTITVNRVTQDEPLGSRGGCGDAVLIDGQAQVRAERSSKGNGRVYTLWFTATDDQGGSTDGSVQVQVPHDRGHGAAVDDGQKYNSIGSCVESRAQREDLDVGATETDGMRLARSGDAVTIYYSLREAGHVRIGVYDVTGRQVSTILDADAGTGSHDLSWNDGALSPGLYFYRFVTGSSRMTRTMVVLR